MFLPDLLFEIYSHIIVVVFVFVLICTVLQCCYIMDRLVFYEHFRFQMKKKPVERDELIEKASRFASCVSISLIIASTTVYIIVGMRLGKVSLKLSKHAEGFEVTCKQSISCLNFVFQSLHFDTESELLHVENEHLRTSRQAWRRQQNRWRSANGNGNSMNGQRKAHFEEPKICGE